MRRSHSGPSAWTLMESARVPTRAAYRTGFGARRSRADSGADDHRAHALRERLPRNVIRSQPRRHQLSEKERTDFLFLLDGLPRALHALDEVVGKRRIVGQILLVTIDAGDRHRRCRSTEEQPAQL